MRRLVQRDISEVDPRDDLQHLTMVADRTSCGRLFASQRSWNASENPTEREPPELAACRWWARGARPGPSPSKGGLEEVFEAYLASRRARFEHHDLDHPATPLFVDVRGRGLSVDQVKYLIERLYVRAGLQAPASLQLEIRADTASTPPPTAPTVGSN